MWAMMPMLRVRQSSASCELDHLEREEEKRRFDVEECDGTCVLEHSLAVESVIRSILRACVCAQDF